MSIDITKEFIKAKAHSSNWEKEIFEHVLNGLLQDSRVSIEWDATVPENWVGVSFKNNLIDIGVLCVKTPLFIVTFNKASFLEDVEYVSILSVPNFHQELYKVDVAVMEALFQKKWSDAIDKNNTSISQIVYATM